MPFIEELKYKSPFFGNGFLETVIPYLVTEYRNINYFRESITTSDKDVLDLDWSFSQDFGKSSFLEQEMNKIDQNIKKQINSIFQPDFTQIPQQIDSPKSTNSKLIIITHGMFASSRGVHIRKHTSTFNQEGFDVLVWHQRGCSDQTNLKEFIYHPGMTQDLDRVVDFVSQKKPEYKEIYLFGVSLGGNLNLKYLGEKGFSLNPKIKKAFNLSAPLNLDESSKLNNTWIGKITEKYILSSLKKVLERKKQQTPQNYVFYEAEKLKKVREFDEKFSVPMHGFRSIEAFYKENSSINFLKNIKIPTFLLSSLNDYILGPSSYPVEFAKNSSNIFLSTPEFGGHSGFPTLKRSNKLWHEEVALAFFDEIFGDFENTFENINARN